MYVDVNITEFVDHADGRRVVSNDGLGYAEAANHVKSNEPESVHELRAALDAILAGNGQRQG